LEHCLDFDFLLVSFILDFNLEVVVVLIVVTVMVKVELEVGFVVIVVVVIVMLRMECFQIHLAFSFQVRNLQLNIHFCRMPSKLPKLIVW